MSSEITIVIPAYNHERYIEQCLVSCVELSCKDRPHLLFVDDGSTDKTFQIAKDFLNKPNLPFASVRIENRKNSGLSGSLNFALKEVKTKYMLILASDDLFDERAIEILLPKIQGDSTAALAVGDNNFIDDSGKKFDQVLNGKSYGSFINFHLARKPDFDWNQLGQYRSFLTGNYISSGWLLDVAKILSIGGWDPTFMLEDWQILVRLTKKYKILFSKEVTAYYRSHSSNTSKTKPVPILFDQARIYLQEYDYAKDNGFLADWVLGSKNTRDSLETHRPFFDYFFQNISKLFSHPNFKPYLASFLGISEDSGLMDDSDFFEKSLCLLKIRLANEIVYYRLKYDPLLATADSIDTVISTVSIYLDAYQTNADQAFIEDWNKGIEQLLVAMKLNAKLFNQFFVESGKYHSHKNSTRFLGDMNRISPPFLPKKGGRRVSFALLLLLKVQMHARMYLKPIKDYFRNILNKIRRS